MGSVVVPGTFLVAGAVVVGFLADDLEVRSRD